MNLSRSSGSWKYPPFGSRGFAADSLYWSFKRWVSNCFTHILCRRLSYILYPCRFITRRSFERYLSPLCVHYNLSIRCNDLLHCCYKQQYRQWSALTTLILAGFSHVHSMNTCCSILYRHLSGYRDLFATF